MSERPVFELIVHVASLLILISCRALVGDLRSFSDPLDVYLGDFDGSSVAKSGDGGVVG